MGTFNRLLRASAVLAAAVILGASSTMPAYASGGGQKPSDPLNAPTFAQQTAHWTAAQFAAYNAKLNAVKDFSRRRASAKTLYSCVQPCVPASHYAYIYTIYEGSADCACGPATAWEMYSTFEHYYNEGPGSNWGMGNFTLGNMESEMAGHSWYSCSGGTYRYGLQDEMNLHQSVDSYIWGAVNSSADVYNDTAIDLGLDNFPVGYDGETYGSHGYPLDNYQGVDWQHYFPAYGYDQYSNVYVADPHYNYNHRYTTTAVYYFIDNFPYTNQVLW